MPASDTFDCKPIREMVKRYLRKSKVSIDPFARNKRWATYTNDMNPETEAEYHMDACDFLQILLNKGVQADLIIFDPPYTLRQAQECYQQFGKWTLKESQNAIRWTKEKAMCHELLQSCGHFLHFGHSSNGLGEKYQMKIVELLLVAHGGAHNDTICLAEHKTAHQMSLCASTI